MQDRFWKIVGYDSTTPIGEPILVSAGRITEKKLRRLLQTLAAKHGLTNTEIVSAYLKKRVKGCTDLLEVQSSAKPFTYSCGSNPHFHATLVDRDGKAIDITPLET